MTSPIAYVDDFAGANDDAKIAAAIASLTTGGQVLFGPRQYDIGAVIDLSGMSNLWFAGSGRKTTTLKLKNAINDDIFYASSGSGFKFTDFNGDGNSANQSAPNGNQKGNLLKLQNVDYAEISNVDAKDFIWHGFMLQGGICGLVDNCTNSNSNSGFYVACMGSIGAILPGTHWKVRDCKVFGTTGGDAYAFDNGNQDCAWENCYVENSAADGFIVFGNVSLPQKRISAVNCTAINSGNNGMSFHSCQDVDIVNPIIEYTGLNASCTEATTGWGHGIDISNNEAHQTEINGIRIRGGSIRNTDKCGIRALDSQGTVIRGLSVIGTHIVTVGLGTVSGPKLWDAVNLSNAYKPVVAQVTGLTGSSGRDAIRVASSVTEADLLNNSTEAGAGVALTDAGSYTHVNHPVSKAEAHIYYTGSVYVDGGSVNFNITSYTRLAAGKVKVTFTNAVADDSNKMLIESTAYSSAGTKLFVTEIDKATNYVTLQIQSDAGTLTDPERIFLKVTARNV